MRATNFEYRHQTLLHLLVVGLALLTYMINPDDIVWALVRHHSNSAFLERIAFGAGALMVLGSAVLETWASAYPYRLVQYPLRLSRLLFALALGLLVPLSGAIILVIGEATLVFRLFVRDRQSATPEDWWQYSSTVPRRSSAAFRKAASKWGLAASMVVFT
jgi:hypothetical protein